MIAMIAAVADNGGIGRDNALPWHLPADLKHFKMLTSGKTVLMGSKTFQSILEATGGKLLPNRRSVVLTRDRTFQYPGVEVVHDIHDVTGFSEDVYIIGGGQVYAAAITLADVLYITEVHTRISGDAHFPNIDVSVWREISRDSHQADERNEYAFDFVTYKKLR